MKNELLHQYTHTWKIFAGLVHDFDPHAWRYAGCGTMNPARVAYHILSGVKYYIEDSSPLTFASGDPFERNIAALAPEALPSQPDLLLCLETLQAKTETWLTEMDFQAETPTFPWAGKTHLSVALFLLRHTLYHVGELSALLNETHNGVAEDNWVKAL